MSLNYLGIAHFPVLHRQFSSPTTQAFSESSPDQDITQDNKDVLIERLNDMVSRLSRSTTLENSAVTAIHSEVDRIETIMRGREKPKKHLILENHGLEMSQSKSNGDEHFWRQPLTPTRNFNMSLSGSVPNSPHLPHHPPQMSPSRAIEIAKAAEELSTRLATTVSELQTRKEESDHLHDLLITRSEKAAERILLLEYRIAEMEDDFESNQSELRFLRIQLQAIEAQCSQYLPRNEDPELSQSIKNWKVDWEDIDRRSKARRKKRHVIISPTDGPHKVVNNS